ncbi:ubiquitin activating enzyme [Aureococcus anophagefferens]|uniref:Ubiquitin activating enzyme n=1 Tax=Aureococcus anophagefferens TaxID=44056 RepID=A0ABR1FMY9_AURAN
MSSMEVDENTTKIDEGLYSRQLYVLGREGQAKMSASSVLVCGLNGVGCEVAKNVILAGVKAVTLFDPTPATWYDVGGSPYVAPSARRDAAAPGSGAKRRGAQPLRRRVRHGRRRRGARAGDLHSGDAGEWAARRGLRRRPLRRRASDASSSPPGGACRQAGACFVAAECRGVCCALFCDFGDAWAVTDVDGKRRAACLVASVTQSQPALVTVTDEQRHGMNEGDVVQIASCVGAEDGSTSTPSRACPRRRRRAAATRRFARVVFGDDVLGKLKDAKLFLVGAGAIGCEMLKNWALLGVGAGADGSSSLASDIGEAKSTTAAAAARALRPEINVTPLELRVGPDSRASSDDAFLASLTGVCTALDNVDARLYVDSKCLFYHLPMFESGTLGTKGNTQVVVPGLTSTTVASRDPPEKSIPVCTLKNFPNKIEHTLQWARDWFEGAFKQGADDVNMFWSGAKRAPATCAFDANDALHLDYVKALARSGRRTHGINSTLATYDAAFYKAALDRVIVPDFSPRDGVKISANEAEEKKAKEEVAGGGASAPTAPR